AELGHRLADQGGTDLAVGRREEARRHHRQEGDEQAERHPQDQPPHASASRNLARRSRSSRPSSDRKPPKATIAPPSQIKVTIGFHHSRSCQRPCESVSPSET